jgi:hypothetical protein
MAWDRSLPARYSLLSPSERREVKAMYVAYQGDTCYYCKGNLKQAPPEKIANIKVKPHYYPKGFFENSIHLHHNHSTDLTLGAVHAHCNAVLWEYHGE